MPVAVTSIWSPSSQIKTCLRTESHRVGELGVMDHVAILPVHRHEVLRAQQLVEGAQFALARVTRGVDRLVARVDHLGRGAVQVVDHATDRPLVARDRVRTEDDRVVGADLEESRVAARELRQRGQRLALAAGADDAHLTRARSGRCSRCR